MSDSVRRRPDRLRPIPTGYDRRRSAILPALALLALAAPALAAPRMDGRFAGRGEGMLELKVAGGTADSVRVEASTAIRNTCTGELSGLAKPIASRTLLLREAVDDGGTCELTLRFSPDYVRVTMSEQGCSYFHGTACAFVGTLRRR